MDEALKEQAEERLESALEESGARDPRGYYRERLVEIRSRDRDAYDDAIRYYEETLIPEVAGGDADPLVAWRAFGRRLAELTAEGRTVEIDRSGRSHSHEPPSAEDRLILHLPTDASELAMVVSLPPELSAAQRAAYDLLVRGKRTLNA